MQNSPVTTPTPAPAQARSLIRPYAGLGDEAFRLITMAFGLVAVGLILWIAWGLYSQSATARHMFGLSLLAREAWDVNHNHYGALPFVLGTLVSAAIALLIAVPVGVGCAFFLTELAPRWLATPVSFVIELLAAIPSVIFGLWGFFVMCPWMDRTLNPWLSANFGALPLFSGVPVMTCTLAAGFILAIMVLPFITSVSREVIRTVPAAQREAALGLGATRWETSRSVVLRAARSGIVGAIILALGRAIGETMAVVMVIGNSLQYSSSLLQPGNTMPALLANQFNEAQNEPVQRSVLIEIALILFVITVAINAIARLLILLTTKQQNANSQAASEAAWMDKARTGLGIALAAVVGVALVIFVVLQIVADVRHYGVRAVGSPVELVLIAVGTVRFVTWLLRPRAGENGAMERVGQWLIWRKLNNVFMNLLMGICAFAACSVLGLLLGYVAVQGAHALNLDFFTQLPKPPDEPGGGFKNGIVGTLVLIGVASAVGIPLGLMGGIFLAEYRATRVTGMVRFAADVLNGIPSVVIGMFAYAAFVLPFKKFSALSGGLALGIMMLPTIIRTTEEMLRLVPNHLREASLGLGATRLRTIWTVVLPAARGGVVTGIMLAIARIAGETAPLLFTAFGNQYLSVRLDREISSITLMIFNYARSPYQAWIDQAWAGALVLVLLVTLISLIARFATRSRYALR